MTKPNTYYRVTFVGGGFEVIRVPSGVTSPTFAMEHGVPMFGWVDDGDNRLVINPANVLYVQEIDLVPPPDREMGTAGAPR